MEFMSQFIEGESKPVGLPIGRSGMNRSRWSRLSLFGAGLMLLFSGGMDKVTAVKAGGGPTLEVNAICAQPHEYVGRYLPSHIDLNIKGSNLDVMPGGVWTKVEDIVSGRSITAIYEGPTANYTGGSFHDVVGSIKGEGLLRLESGRGYIVTAYSDTGTLAQAAFDAHCLIFRAYFPWITKR